LALNGHEVSLWARNEDGFDELRETRRSPYYLPKLKLPASVDVVQAAAPDVEMAVFPLVSHAMRAVAEQLDFPCETIRVSCAKGLEAGSLLRMSEVLADVYPGAPIAALSGPSHAEEVANDLPTTVVAASPDGAIAETIQQAFLADCFRVYTSSDIVGVELGGSLKNVLAIAAGACDGFNLGDNAKAALITRGLAEMARLGEALGADPMTFAGLTGMGDLIVTCASQHSRNRAVGEAIAQGKSPEDVLGGHMVAEGVRNAEAAYALAQREGVDMPITDQVYGILFEGVRVRDAIQALMNRDPKPERE
jgi:glycerol-3-phosphate dehydrogenase (NAD(P)+)